MREPAFVGYVEALAERSAWPALLSLLRAAGSELELEALIKQYAMALSFYDRYKERGVTSVAQLRAKLEELKAQEKPRSSQVRAGKPPKVG